ncbi:type-F conjugative transfer system secretin TraK [Photobacterium leiognathi]|uniref:type-F conjugative transfer system secretin TraK n=1 Tax=Photobacterium leiognathi TaxID=553611 RepID=UPI00273A321B|nr:type-F conjugative transfer system secretin TraK [Photobacterium leiognathi]
MTRFLFALSMWMLTPLVWAQATPPTTVPFADNETVSLTLSSLDINRLVVRGDRITSVTCPTGFCTLPMSGEEGAIAAPTDPQGASLIALEVQEPFTLYITTEKGHSFGAFVRPLAVPAVTTVFVPLARDTQQAAQFEKSSPYEEVIASLIRHMISETVPQGYQITPVTMSGKRKQADSTPQEVTLTPTLTYQGEVLTGTVYTVTNNTANTVTLHPTAFYQQGVKALSFSSPTLRPHSSLVMYQVTGR